MSAVLEAFIEPYIEVADTERAYRTLFTLAAAAWNIALFPLEKQQQMLDDFLNNVRGVPASLREDTRAILMELIERKNVYFSENRRMILSWELTDTGRDYHLSVVSTLDNVSAERLKLAQEKENGREPGNGNTI